MPTKVEQSDLLQVLFGRNGESPIPVVAPATPGECFTLAIEAARIALKYMTPVVYLSDAFVANGAEPWQVPSLDDLPDISVRQRGQGRRPVPPVRARPRDARAPVGRPRHRGPRAPHRRPREGRRPGQRQLRPREPPPDDAAAGPEGGRHRARHPAARDLRGRRGRPADPRLGLDLRRDPQRRRAAPRRRTVRRARPAPLPQPVPEPTRATCCRATRRCSSPRSTSASWRSCCAPPTSWTP